MVVNLARQELCTKPLFLCTLIKSGIPQNHREAFWENLSTAEVNELYKALLPTTSGVLNLLDERRLAARRRRGIILLEKFYSRPWR